jgi:hypothetical protein
MKVVDCSWPLWEGMTFHHLHPRAPRLLSGTLSHQITRRWKL